MHQSMFNVGHMFVSRSEGGKELVQLELRCKITTIVLQGYLETREDCVIICIKEHVGNY